VQKMPQLLGLKSVKVGACFVELCVSESYSQMLELSGAQWQLNP